MLNIAIFEDNKDYLKYMVQIITEIFKEENLNGNICTASDDEELIKKCIYTGQSNVFFLDLYKGQKCVGFYLADEIKKINRDAYIIFITGYKDHVFDSFQFTPFDYLPKPVNKSNINNLLKRLNDDIKRNQSLSECKKISIKIGPVIYNIKHDQIVYIEKYGHRCTFKTIDNEIVCYETLEYLQTELNNTNGFIRCHKSFIANKYFIKEVNFKEMKIVFMNKEACPIGRKYKEEVVNNYGSKNFYS